MGIYIGADGGGTKIAFCLERNGERIFTRKSTSVNPNDAGFDESIRTVVVGMTELCKLNGVSVGDVDGVFAGIAGATTADYIARLKAELDKVFVNSVNAVSHDGENILYAAFPQSDGVIVICGTGSSCFVKKNGVISRIGGYSAFDLDGNGYEIGKRAIAHALRCVDGRDTPGRLCASVNDAFGGSCFGQLGNALAMPVKSIAALAPLVFDAAKEGDSYAEAILESTACFIAEYIYCAAESFTDTFGVCIAGGIGTREPVFSMIKSRVGKIADIFVIETDPVNGAVERAKLKIK